MRLPRDMNPGDPIMASWLNAVKNAVIASLRGDGRSISVKRSGDTAIISYTGNQIIPTNPNGRYQITAIANDYLTGKRIDDATGLPAGDAVYIAKKESLRHDADQYPLVTSLTTVDADTVTMVGAATETAKVTPDWAVGLIIAVERKANGTGVSVGGVPLTLQEATGREWGVE